MAGKIIVATDGGPASRAALAWAITRAQHTGAELELTIVIELGWSPIGGEEQFRPRYDNALLDATRRVEAAVPAIKHTAVVRRGEPVEELVHAAKGAELLVVGTKRTGAFAGIVRGTLSLRIAGAAECPTVVVPAGWQEPGGAVVVGVSEDDSSHSAIDFAVAEAVRLKRRLDVVHAWRVPTTISLENAWEPFTDVRDAHRAVLSDTTARIRATHPRLRIREVLEHGPAAEIIVDAAHDADLVVVGSRGRGAVSGALLGSVSHDLLLNPPCPVVVMPHPDR